MPDRVSYLRAWKLSKVYLDAQWWDPLVSTPVKLLTDCLYLCWPLCFTVLMREGRGFLLSRNKARCITLDDPTADFLLFGPSCPISN